MQPPQRLALIESGFLLLMLLAGTTATVTEARYRQQARAFDQARVARPAVRIIPLTEPADLGELQPGSSKTLEFSIDNRTENLDVSEVGLDYEISIAFSDKESSPLVFSLYWLDDAGQIHICTPAPDGTYSAPQSLGTEPQVQYYQLQIGLPMDAALPSQPRLYAIRIELKAKQRDL